MVATGAGWQTPVNAASRRRRWPKASIDRGLPASHNRPPRSVAARGAWSDCGLQCESATDSAPFMRRFSPPLTLDRGSAESSCRGPARAGSLARRISDRARSQRHPHQRARPDDCSPARDVAFAHNRGSLRGPGRQGHVTGQAKQRTGQRPERGPPKKGSRDGSGVRLLGHRDDSVALLRRYHHSGLARATNALPGSSSAAATRGCAR